MSLACSSHHCVVRRVALVPSLLSFSSWGSLCGRGVLWLPYTCSVRDSVLAWTRGHLVVCGLQASPVTARLVALRASPVALGNPGFGSCVCLPGPPVSSTTYNPGVSGVFLPGPGFGPFSREPELLPWSV